MSTHLPLRSLRPLHRQCLPFLLPQRAFSTTPTLERNLSSNRKARQVDPVTIGVATRYQRGKASSSQNEEQFRDARNLPDDIGLVPGTFVHAPMFPLTRFSLKDRIWYEWKWIRARLTSWYQLRRFRQEMGGKPRMFWFGRKPRQMLGQDAVLKYKALYDSFAKADSKTISALCVSGVAKEFQTRIATRPAGARMQWGIQGEPSCKIVSNIAMPLELPGYENTGVHQIVFRIQSKQTLEIGEVEGSSKKKKDQESATTSSDIVEYMVLQKQYIRGKAKSWKVFGFTDVATLKSIEETEEYARKVNAYQAA